MIQWSCITRFVMCSLTTWFVDVDDLLFTDALPAFVEFYHSFIYLAPIASSPNTCWGNTRACFTLQWWAVVLIASSPNTWGTTRTWFYDERLYHSFICVGLIASSPNTCWGTTRTWFNDERLYHSFICVKKCIKKKERVRHLPGYCP